MKYFTLFIAIAVQAASASVGQGHGVPVKIDSDGQRLSVSGGLASADGFARMSFDHSEDAFLYDVFDGSIAWTTPGFDRIGGAIGLPLTLQVLSRPDFSESPLVNRWLWHWDASTSHVERTENDRFLALNSEINPVPFTFTFTQFAGPGGTDAIELPMLHHPLEFALDDSLPSPAANGIYGFFARLSSPGLEPSEPILIALNYNVSLERFDEGTEAINRAAGLPGDYDHDVDVDGNDFLVWQRTLGASGGPAADGSLNGVVDGSDLDVWRQNFGRRTDLGSFVAAVPEPGGVSIVIAATTISSCGIRFGRRRGRRRPGSLSDRR